MWPDIAAAYRWVHRAAAVLGNRPGRPAAAVRRRLAGLLGAMRRHRGRAGRLAGAVDHFLKVTASYWPGLFAGYDVPGLPRTNNDLEQLFGSHRHHERRATGRKTASPALVLRGSVRLIAGLATRRRSYTGEELGAVDRAAWRAARARLAERQQRRARRSRFRRDPGGFLAQLEELLIQPALPA